MNLILLEPHEIDGDQVLLTDHRAEHIVKVLRAKTGDGVRVGVVNGQKGIGVIGNLRNKYPFSALLTVNFQEGMEDLPPIDLILALPRPIMLRRILSQAAALGVGRIFLVNARRVEKSFWDATSLEPSVIRSHLLTGLEQAVATRVPEVSLHTRFKPFIEDEFPVVQSGYDRKIIGHPTGESRLAKVVVPGQGRLVMAIGPEGGWIDYEVKKFKEQGFVCCTMGDRILKVDTAVIALHARMSVLMEG